MAKLLIVFVIFFLIEINYCLSNDINDSEQCSCSQINSDIDDIKNMLIRQREQSCRKVCPSGFDYLPEADSCFKVIFQPLDWFRAGQVCRKVMPGVHLAAITSASKQEAIEIYLEQEFNRTESSVCLIPQWPGAGNSVWIGGQTKDPDSCGTPYVWKTLEGVEIPFNYTNWLIGEPNCGGNAEKCAHIAAGLEYTWNDNPCNFQICALCEF